MASEANAVRLFSQLESNDKEKYNQVMAIIQDHLSSNSKEAWIVYGLIDYYFNTNSLRCFQIFPDLSPPHQKHLFDKLSDSTKNSTTRIPALMLFGRIICKLPSWLFKVANHSLMSNMLKVLKTDNDVVVLLVALLNLINLLPVIPAIVAPNLNNIFEIFSRLAAWNTTKAANIPETSILHFQVGVYSLFHRLYGMYPCNFLSYLRSHYGNRENLEIFAKTIRPMLDRVRMHPLLVTASKESELSTNRWRKMEPHAIVMECAKVSLDLIEGIGHELFAYQLTVNPDRAAESPSVTLSGACSYVSNEAFLLTRKLESSTKWSSLPDDSTSDTHEAIDLNPSTSSSYLTSPRASATKAEFVSSFGESQPSSPLRMISSPSKFTAFTDDLLVKKDLPKLGATRALLFLESSTEEKSASGKFFHTRSNDSDSDVDKEVSDLVARRKPGSSILEDSGREEESNVTLCQRSDSVIHDEPEGIQTEDYEECGNSSFSQVVELMRKVTRFRYYSHCGQAPEISELKPKIKFHRSQSCPNMAELLQLTQHMAEPSVLENASNLVQSGDGKDEIKAVSNEGQDKLETAASLSRTELMLKALPMMAPTCCYGCQYCLERGAVVKEMSPAEILDKHVYFGSELHMKDLAAFAGRNTSTSDEVSIMKNQLVLLYNQLLYERHRRSLHAERNRSLLAKLKKMQIPEEQFAAEKEQLKRKEIDLQESRQQYYCLTKHKVMELVDNTHNAEALASENRVVKIDIHTLKSENEKLKKMLYSSEGLNEERLKELQSCQAKLQAVTIELQDLKIKLAENTKVQTELERVKKEHLLLGELQQKYREKLSSFSNQTNQKIETSILMGSYKMEIDKTKTQLGQRTQQTELMKARLIDFESQLNKKEVFINEQKNLYHKVQEEYEERVRVLEERNKESLNHVSRLVTYIRLVQSDPAVHNSDLYRQMPNVLEPFSIQFSQPRLGVTAASEVVPASSRRSSAGSDVFDPDAADSAKKQ